MTVEAKKQGLCKIHNARFYNLPPRAINSFAYNQENSWLALTRFVNIHKKINMKFDEICSNFYNQHLSIDPIEMMHQLKFGIFNMHHICSRQ